MKKIEYVREECPMEIFIPKILEVLFLFLLETEYYTFFFSRQR